MSTLSTGTAMAVVAFALSRGLTTAQVQKVTGVSCFDLLKPDSRPPENIMPRICAALAEKYPDEPFALEMARSAPFSYFGGIADGAQFAGDLRTVIKLFSENSSVIADDLTIDFREEGGTAQLTSIHSMDDIDNGRSHEVGMGLFARLCTDFLGVSNCLLCVTFKHKPNCDVVHYVEHFGVPVDFQAEEMAIHFKPEKLNAKIKYANAELFNYIRTHLSEVQKRIRVSKESKELAVLRKAAAENAMGGVFNSASVAAAANMSLRSAQRLTSKHGTSVQQLIEEFREHRARELLSEGDNDINAIAFLLGYSDDRAFRRAFQRWTRQTPSEFRGSQ